MQRPYNILVLCTGNSARSILAEALFNTLGAGRIKAYSAGSHPCGRVNLFAIEQVRALGYPVENLRSKSWDEFAEPGAPEMDFVITVCDNAAGEACPVWPGQPMTAHWGVPDPAAVAGTPAEIARAYRDAFTILERRISLLLALPLATLDKMAIKRELGKIGGVGLPE